LPRSYEEGVVPHMRFKLRKTTERKTLPRETESGAFEGVGRKNKGDCELARKIDLWGPACSLRKKGCSPRSEPIGRRLPHSHKGEDIGVSKDGGAHRTSRKGPRGEGNYVGPNFPPNGDRTSISQKRRVKLSGLTLIRKQGKNHNPPGKPQHRRRVLKGG